MQWFRTTLVLAIAVGSCESSAPEDELKGLIASAESAAESHDLGFFRELVGPSYRDSRGNDRDRLLDLIRGYLLVNRNVEIITAVDEVAMQGQDVARLVVRTSFSESAARAVFGGGQTYRVDLELVKIDSDWRVIGASWQPDAGER